MTTFASLSLLLFASSGQGGPGLSALLIQVALFIAIGYFLLIRPQRRQQEQHRQLLASLQRGDRVVTSGGIIGEVIHIKDDEVTLKSGESRVVVLRTGITSITNRQAAESKPA
ncbi:MAG: preprotein translocase subunit YajC [Gemmatimonadales bacterium]